MVNKEGYFLYSTKKLEQLYSRGYYLYETGNFEGAVEIFQSLLIINPNHFSYLQGLAASLQMIQEYYRAIHCWSILIDLVPTNLSYYLHLAECLISMRAISQALQIVQKAKNLMADSPAIKDRSLYNQILLLEERWSAPCK